MEKFTEKDLAELITINQELDEEMVDVLLAISVITRQLSKKINKRLSETKKC